MKKVLILAGGTGSRLKLKKPKQFLKIKDKMLIEYTLDACKKTIRPENIFIVCHKDWIKYLQKNLPQTYHVIPGGKTRIESTVIGLSALQATLDDYVYILEPNRPLIQSSWLSNIYTHLKKAPTAYIAMYTQPVNESIFDDSNKHFRSVQKSHFLIGQTPYLFTGEAVLQILRKTASLKNDQFDIISLLDPMRIKKVPALFENIKITSSKDIKTIEKILS